MKPRLPTGSPDWAFNLLVKAGGICSISTIVGLGVSISAYLTWLVSSPLDSNYAAAAHEFANKAVSATAPFVVGMIVLAIANSFLLDCEWRRLRLKQEVNNADRVRNAAEQINAQAIELIGIKVDLKEIRFEQTRLRERQAELERQLSNLTTADPATDFFPPSSPSRTAISERGASLEQADCRYLNRDRSTREYLRCPVEPDRLDCLDCRSYRPQNESTL